MLANKTMSGLRASQVRRLFSRPIIDVLFFSKYLLSKKTRSLLSSSNRRTTNESHRLVLHGSFIGEEEEMEKVAELLLSSGIVRIFGTDIEIGWPPNWDGINEPNFPRDKPSSKIKYYGKDVNYDIKTAWEIHRMQWLPSIAFKAKKTNDLALANEIVDMLTSYHENHRTDHSIAWMEGIEVSLRSISIIETMKQIEGIGLESEKIKFISSILAINANWLNSNLSKKWRMNNNHLLLELIGLGIISRVLPGHPDSDKWKAVSEKSLEIEITKQTLSGRNWEPTTAYHRFVTEAMLVLHEYRKSEIMNGGEDKILSTTKVLYETLQYLSDRHGSMSLIGDDDAGLVLPVHSLEMNPEDNGRVLRLGQELGFNGAAKIHQTKIWENHGTAMLRTGDSTCHLVSGAPKGIARQASHRHLDMLSISVRFRGRGIILDGGTGRYFGNEELRNSLRSEKSHSGIYSADMKWATMSDLFEIPKPPIGRVEKLSPNSIAIEAYGKSGMSARREVISTERGYKIKDRLSIKNPRIRFLVNELGTQDSDGGIWIMRFDGWEIRQTPFPVDVCMEKREYSPGYGILEDCHAIEFGYSTGSSAQTEIIFLP